MVFKKHFRSFLAVFGFCFLSGTPALSKNTTIAPSPSQTMNLVAANSLAHVHTYVNQTVISSEISSAISSSLNDPAILATSTGFSPSITTHYPGSSKKLETRVIIVIAVCAAALVIVVVLLLVCIFRRKRTRRLQREANLSYNNMNYESTVKFKFSENGEHSSPDSEANQSPQKNNNRQRAGEYEVVNLPNDHNTTPRKYENVTPRKSNKDNRAPELRGSYENVTPLASPSKETPKTEPYEEVTLSSPNKTDGKKHYENVDLSNK